MNLLFSTIGKKIQVAISGIFLMIFLLFHLINNLMLFGGPDQFNAMVHFLESIKPLVRIMECGLLLLLCIHTINAFKLTLNNKKLTSTYNRQDYQKFSSLNSRTMAISGSVILIFIIIHLFYIWWTYQTHAFTLNETYYDVILRNKIGYLNHLPTAIFYVLAIFFIGVHLKHGFESALKTFGLTLDTPKAKLLYSASIIFWGIIPAGFIFIILCIQIGIIK